MRRLTPFAVLALAAVASAQNLYPDPGFEQEGRPGDAQLHVELAMARRDQGRTDDAIAVCRTAIEHAPDDARAHVLLAHLLLLAGRYLELLARQRAAASLAHLNRLIPEFAHRLAGYPDSQQASRIPIG